MLYLLRCVATSMLCLASGVGMWSCGGPQSSAPPEDEVVVSRPPGTEHMAYRLERLFETRSPLEIPFENGERLRLLEQRPRPENAARQLLADAELAMERLRAGASKEAAATFEQVVRRLDAQPELLDTRRRRRIRSLLAVAYLRVGEQDNCIDGDGQEACVWPISVAGRHHHPQGAGQAQEVLAEMLREDSDDLLSRWLYNLAAMVLGTYPDGVPPAWRIDPRHLGDMNAARPWKNVAPALELDVTGLAGGSVVDDLDGDGWLDVMVSSWGLRDPMHLLLARPENGMLRFEDRTAAAGLQGFPGGLNLVPGDYDNDGDVDVLVLRGAWLGRQGRWPNSLLRNDGHGRFEDVTEALGLLSFHPTQTAAWGDYDNDGWLDLYIGNESTSDEIHRAELYRNTLGEEAGSGGFVEVAAEARVAVQGFVKGVAWGDIDNDGWLDLYVSRMGGENWLFRNVGPDATGVVRFEDVSQRAGVQSPVDSFPTWFFDYDQDGWLDLFVADYATEFVDARAVGAVADYLGRPTDGSTTRLYRNRHDGTFEDVSQAIGLGSQLLAMGANFGDIDQDGWPDLYVGTGAPDFSALVPNRLFRNDGGRRFVDITSAARVGHLQKGHGVSFADLDHDGDQDILAVLGGAFSGDVYQNALFANPGHGQRWVTLVLEGVASNRSAVGARLHLRLETPDGRRSVFSTVSTGGSFGASTLRQELGLGDATAIPSLEVAWPGGKREEFRDLPMERCLRVRQAQGKVEPMDCPRLAWSEGVGDATE